MKPQVFLFTSLFAIGCAGSGLDANDDSAETALGVPVEIPVLDNDEGLPEEGEVQVEIVNSPLSGSATVEAGGVILYVPNELFIGADDIKYRVSSGGDSDEARIGIDVECDTCLSGRNIRLSWTPNHDAGTVRGFRVYTANETEDFAEMSMQEELSEATADFDMNTPERVYDAWGDMLMQMGDTVCFRVTAFNTAGESGPSDSACVTIDENNSDKADFPVGL